VPYDDEGSHLDIVDANGVLVTETSYFTDNDHPNTRLIAAAPELLAEVKRLEILLDREERFVALLLHEFYEEQKLMFTDEFNKKVSEIYEPQEGGEEDYED
jgi:hypothetical protein